MHIDFAMLYIHFISSHKLKDLNVNSVRQVVIYDMQCGLVKNRILFSTLYTGPKFGKVKHYLQSLYRMCR